MRLLTIHYSIAPAAADKDLDSAPPKDEDPDGLKLIAGTDALEQAANLLTPLKTLAPNNIDAWIAIYDVAIRRSTSLSLFAVSTHD